MKIAFGVALGWDMSSVFWLTYLGDNAERGRVMINGNYYKTSKVDKVVTTEFKEVK